MVLYRRPPDGQWARTGTADSSIVRFLLPIGGGGSAEVALEAAFSYKLPRADRILVPACPQPSTKVMLGMPTLSYKTHMAVTTSHNEQ